MKRVLRMGLMLPAVAAMAASPAPDSGVPVRGPKAVDIVEVHGSIDPAVSAYVEEKIDAAHGEAALVVLQLDSPGSLDAHAIRLAAAIRRSRVPVVAWVGPAGASAAGAALFLVYSSSLQAMAPGAGIGPARPFDLGTRPSDEDPEVVRALGSRLIGLASSAGAPAAGVRRLLHGALPAGQARDAGAVAVLAPDIPALLRSLHGRSLRTARGPTTLTTLDARDRIAVSMRFHHMGPIRRVLHALSTPTAVFLMLALGVWAVAFELTQPGLGVAGIGGVLALGLAGYGLTVVPVNWLGLAVLLAGMALQGLDVLIRRVGALTAAGTVAFGAGAFMAWGGVAPALDLSAWLVVLLTFAGALFFGFALTVALRSRERTRAEQVGLVGLVGEVRSDLNPEGGVFVKGAIWRARSMDGPIPKGRRVRVRGIDGLILRVVEEE